MTITFFVGTDGQLFAPSLPILFALRSIDSDTCHVQSQNWPVGGRLGRFWKVCVGIGASRRVVRWLKNGCSSHAQSSSSLGSGNPASDPRLSPIFVEV